MAMYKKTPDIIIRNGTVVDGTGAPAYYADIAIVGDKIDYIGKELCGHFSAVLIVGHDYKYVGIFIVNDRHVVECFEIPSVFVRSHAVGIVGCNEIQLF